MGNCDLRYLLAMGTLKNAKMGNIFLGGGAGVPTTGCLGEDGLRNV